MIDSAGQTTKRVGVEISGTAINAVIIGAGGEIVNKQFAGFNAQDTVAELSSIIVNLKAEFGDFDRIGIAVPGLVERSSGRVAFSANIPHHAEVDLASEIENASGLKVQIENDANAAAYGEFRLGAGRGSRDIFYATLGEGVGGAFIINGEIWRGASGFAGEFGFVPINEDGERLEDVASSPNIVKRTRSRLHQDSTSSLNKIGEESITLTDIISAAAAEDDFAKMMLERTGMYVGTVVASVINLFNIEKIVVGGEILQPKQIVLDAIIARASELSFARSFESTSIVAAEIGPNAAAIGAAFISDT